MEADGSSNVIVIICHTAWHHIQKDHNLHVCRCENLQISHAQMFYFADTEAQCHKHKYFERKSVIL